MMGRMGRIHPIYVDGPLEGQDFPADRDSPTVQALDYGGRPWGLTLHADVVTYQLRQFAFHSGGKGVSFWIGSCAPGEPAVTIFRALCKPELLDRAEVLDMPARAARK
jgi:hypothetical protein